uniref:Uncharacterized protein n=2 Tax=Araucaria cunninghamii TaxID=56994 RepID=A0A0D6QVS0_ARACU
MVEPANSYLLKLASIILSKFYLCVIIVQPTAAMASATITLLDEAQPQLKVSKISAVAPAIPTSRQRIFLSILDFWFLPFRNVQRLFFYRISAEDEYSLVVDRLRESLSSVLVYFYPLAGRIDNGESGRPAIDCNDDGVEFVEASIDMPFQLLERDGFERRPFFQTLVRVANPLLHQNYTPPVLSIQVTAFEGSGICIGTTLHHAIADGNSFWHFMKSWVECSRGLPVSKPPDHRRSIFIRENKGLASISLKAQEVSNDRFAGAKIFNFVPDDLQPEHGKPVGGSDPQNQEETAQNWVDPSDKLELVYSKFRFKKERIRDLKQRAGASSSFVAVTAQFWRCVMIARGVPPEEDVSFTVLVDLRGRVKPPLPSSYFGNCISVGVVKIKARKLVNEDISFAAGLIEEVINFCTTETYVNNMMEWLRSPDNGYPSFLSERGRYATNAVGSPRFPLYDIDYGWGKPLNVQLLSINGIGGMVLDPASDGGGSIVVSTRLPQHQMETLSELLFV